MSLETPQCDCEGRRMHVTHPGALRHMAILIAQGMASKDIVLFCTVTIVSPMRWLEVIRIYGDRCRACQSCREDRREVLQGAAEPDCPQSRENQNEQRPPRFFREWA